MVCKLHQFTHHMRKMTHTYYQHSMCTTGNVKTYWRLFHIHQPADMLQHMFIKMQQAYHCQKMVFAKPNIVNKKNNHCSLKPASWGRKHITGTILIEYSCTGHLT